jgi:hypothetical protein
MSRMKRKPKTTKSEHWMRCALEHNSSALNAKVRGAFDFPMDEEIEWRSPLAEDDYAEYRDQCFLDRLGIKPSIPLEFFWPSRGPQWDGLARTPSKKIYSC